ncbi:sensor histidine kinase [Amnibacterium flavum]|uniref:histidine kinase n=1 Tax=Amnibacterium flavum TaxID=2173173 RepID=A0A2V1HQC4_9MICO|nr:histidine kinase [Amnibacterium flavum]PVZ94735.1 histidine kinase [Amnibacterium flavum]
MRASAGSDVVVAEKPASARFWARVLDAVSRLRMTSVMATLAVVAAISLVAVETTSAVVYYGVPLVVAFGLVIVQAGSIPVAVVRPTLGAVLSVVAALTLQWLSDADIGGPWPWWVALIISQTLTLFVVAVRANWLVAVSAWILAVASSAVLSRVLRPDLVDPSSINLVVFSSISGAALIIGIVLAQWGEIRAQLLRERSVSIEEYSRRRLVEDRARIARELHDVIAHGLSIINVQSTTAPYRNPGLDERVAQEFQEIAASSRQALGEMRALLGVLRDDVPSGVKPQPRVSDVGELVASAERAGMAVTLDWLEPQEMDDVTEVVGLAAYRIVQEALSNAIRHAPGTAVTVVGSRDERSLSITVTNTAPSGALPPSGEPGFGLVGMAERAASVAGTVSADADGHGGFVVRAILPLRGADYESVVLS